MKTKEEFIDTKRNIDLIVSLIELVEDLIDKHYGVKATAIKYAFTETLTHFEDVGMFYLPNLEKSADITSEDK